MGVDEGQEKKSITIFLADAQGERTGFKLKLDTPLQKVFSNFENKEGVQAGTFYFVSEFFSNTQSPHNIIKQQYNLTFVNLQVFDGHRLKSTDTPKMLEMEEDDQIDVMVS